MVVPLRFGWRHLLFANWPVESEVLSAHLPDALSVDEYDGRNSESPEGGTGWLSVIPLLNVDVRPRGFPEAVGVPLPELNLRTYVTRDGEPGIYFFSLDAQGLLSTLGARFTHFLPYFYARGRFRREDGRIEFESRRLQPGDRPARYSVSYSPTGERFVADPGSLAEFLVERRRLYTQSPSGALRYTDVTHERWPLYPAEVTTTENTLFEANGFDHPTGEPTCYYSPGVDVTTARSKRW